jgi:hypothetical protein
MKDPNASSVPEAYLPLYQWHNDYHYDKQKLFVDAVRDYWEIVFLAGNGTGKSHILYWSLITLALGLHPRQIAEPPLKIKVMLHDFEHGYDKIFTETCLYEQYMHDGRVLKPMLTEGPYMVTSWPSRDNKTLKFFNGSEFFFQTSGQKKRQHSGTNFDILACDEEAEKPKYDESKRGLRTAKGGGRIFHAYTPPFDEEDKQRGPSWTKFDLIDPFEKGEDPDTMVVRSSMSENPAVTSDYIRKFSKGKTEEQIRIQVYGDYPTWGEMIHPEFQDEMWNPDLRVGHLLPDDIEIPWNDPDVKFEMSVDWHPSKPPAILWSFEYLAGPNKGDVIFFDEISPLEGKGMTISATSKAIREHEGWKNLKIKRWGDPKAKDKNNALISGFCVWDEFRHCGIRLVEANNRNPEVGIAVVNDFFRGKGKNNPDHPRVFIRENCRTLRHNLKNHYWKKREDGTGNPDPKFSDYCVNVRYHLAPKSRRIKKNMDRREDKWPMTAYGNYILGQGRKPAATIVPRLH